MNTLICLLLTATAAVEVALAPDQPLSYVYVDDPLIIELKAAQNGVAEVHLTVTSALLETPLEIDLPPLELRALSSKWHPVRDLPSERGLYRVKATVTLNGTSVQHELQFYRVDRPPATSLLPAYAHGVDNNPRAMLALSTAGVPLIRLNASQQDIQERLRQAVRQKFRTVVFLDPTELNDPAALVEELSRVYCGTIVRWEINPHGDPALLGAMADTVRKAGCNASIAVVIPDAATLAELLQYKTGHQVREAVLLNDAPTEQDIADLRRLTEQAGYEAWRVHVLGKGVPTGSGEQGLRLIQQIFTNLSMGVEQTGFDSTLVFSGRLEPALGYLSGASHRLMATQYVGPLAVGSGNTAHVFRDDGQWLIVAWAAAERNARINLGEAATDLVISNAFHNTLDAKKTLRGELTLALSPEPVYITGRGGRVLGEAARAMTQRHAREFTAQFGATLPPELTSVVATFANNPSSSTNRINYFAILRALPELERMWHSGQLPRAVAAPAIAQLCRLARSLATVEEERGEPFLEPLQVTLARGEEQQSLYLTGSTGSSEANERGDWLVDEVRRLLDEAEELAQSQRMVEANAVATLAEWRAQGLQYAAQAKPASEEAEAVEIAMLPLPNAAPPPPEPEPVAPPEVAAVVVDEPAPPPQRQEVIHEVARGESLSVIAAKYKVTVEDLLAWNNLTLRSTLRIGQELVIRTITAETEIAVAANQPPAGQDLREKAPVPEVLPEVAPVAAPEPAAPETPAGPAGDITHVVVRGETPGGIAQKYNVRLSELIAWNRLSRNPRLQIGQELLIRGKGPAPTESAPAPETEEAAAPAPPPASAPEAVEAAAPGRTHKVKRGENPSIIASNYRISLDDFLAWNKFNRNVRFQVGQEVLVSSPGAGASPAPAPEPEPEAAPRGPRTITHTVQRGDTIDSIARQYGVDREAFRRLNGLRQNATLAAGKRYKVEIRGDAPSTASSAPAASGKGRVHRVARGESPYIISQKYKISLDDLLRWNKLNRRSTLQVGQELIVSAP